MAQRLSRENRIKEVSLCLYIVARRSSFVLFLTKEEMCLSALFDEILLENVNKVQERISVACAWFYARYLMDDSEDEMLFRANRLLIPRKYPALTPQGPHEAELLESSQHSRKKALLKAQLYDIVEEYGERFRMDGTQAPPTVIDGLNSCVDSFITNTVDQLSLKMQQGFSRGATVDQMISTLTLAFCRQSPAISQPGQRFLYTGRLVRRFAILRYRPAVCFPGGQAGWHL